MKLFMDMVDYQLFVEEGDRHAFLPIWLTDSFRDILSFVDGMRHLSILPLEGSINLGLICDMQLLKWGMAYEVQQRSTD